MSLSKYQIADVENLKINTQAARFPVCITWTHLPVFTLLVPTIGHTGVCTSDGIIHDFAGPYYISIDDFAFGSTKKYLQLDISPEELPKWNEAVLAADRCYRQRMHNICCDNCHSHVARALNNFKYKGRANYTMVDVWWMLIVKGKYVSFWAAVYTYALWIVGLATVIGLSFI